MRTCSIDVRFPRTTSARVNMETLEGGTRAGAADPRESGTAADGGRRLGGEV